MKVGDKEDERERHRYYKERKVGYLNHINSFFAADTLGVLNHSFQFLGLTIFEIAIVQQHSSKSQEG